jgi:hypothetical protein
LIGLALGLCFGLILGFLGFAAAGVGHGTYVLIGLSSSPFGLSQNIFLTWFGAPIFWCIVAALSGAATHRLPRALFLATMIAHYAALPIILGRESNFGDWGYVTKAAGVVAVGVAVYAVGQGGLWIAFGLGLWQSRQSARFGTKDILLMTVLFVALYLAPGLAILAHYQSLDEKDYDFTVEQPAHGWTVQLVKSHIVKDLPSYDGGRGSDYTDSACACAGTAFQCVHPLEFGGELCTWDRQANTVRCEKIPQPGGFRQEFDFESYFGNPALWLNGEGDQFIRWDLGGNCDHGLAVRRRGSPSFTAARVGLCLASSKAICNPEGTWYLLAWKANMAKSFELSVYAVDDKLRLTLVGKHRGSGHHGGHVLDAAFATKDRLHIVWADVLTGAGFHRRGNWLRLRTIDLDLRTQQWLEEKEIWRLDRFVSSVSPAVHILEDGSTHYLWKVDGGQTNTVASGLFYQARDTGRTIKLADGYEGFKSLVIGDKIAVCYTLEANPEKLYFRVIRGGVPGPSASIRLARVPPHALGGEDMVLGSDAGRTFWFVNTLDINTQYQLELVERR